MRIKKMGMRAFACAAAAVFATGIGFHAASADEEVAFGIDVRLPIVVQTDSEGVGVGLMVIENLGETDDALIGVGGPEGVRVAMHVTGNEDAEGVVSMTEIDELHISGKSTSIMSPDSAHLMLFEMDPELEFGDFMKLTLAFKEAGSIEIEAVVVDELPPVEFAAAAYLDVEPSELDEAMNRMDEGMHEDMHGDMYGGMHGPAPRIVYVPVYIPVPQGMGYGMGHGMGYGMGYGHGMGHGMGYGMDHGMGHGMGHGMDHGMDHDMGHGMGYGMGHDMGHGMGHGHGMSEPYYH